MAQSAISKISGITIKDKIGYALGDMGGQMTFGLIGAFLQMFYTDVLGILPLKITVLMFAARIWDAINDPLWGSIIDRRKPSKYGRYRPYLLWISPLMTLSAVFMFLRLPGLSENGYLVFAYISYIAYGMIYTGINIPYGSLASLITEDEIERSDLSIFRSIGSGVGSLPAQVLLPMFVYSTAAETGKKYLDYNKLIASVIVLALVSFIVYFLSFKMTKERVEFPPVKQKSSTPQTIKALFKNRPFVVLCAISMLQIGVTLYSQTVNGYLFKDKFENPGLFSLYSIFTYLPMVLLLPILSKMVKRYGKKELCRIGVVISVVANLIAFITKVDNPYIYLVFCFLSGLGITFLTMEIWAMVTDVIDYQELIFNRREEGTVYSFYSFARKLGHTLAGSGSSAVLKLIGYVIPTKDNPLPVQSEKAIKGMYSITTLIPTIGYALIFVLFFFYPLGKKELPPMAEELAKIRAERATNGDKE